MNVIEKKKVTSLDPAPSAVSLPFAFVASDAAVWNRNELCLIVYVRSMVKTLWVRYPETGEFVRSRELRGTAADPDAIQASYPSVTVFALVDKPATKRRKTRTIGWYQQSPGVRPVLVTEAKFDPKIDRSIGTFLSSTWNARTIRNDEPEPTTNIAVADPSTALVAIDSTLKRAVDASGSLERQSLELIPYPSAGPLVAAVEAGPIVGVSVADSAGPLVPVQSSGDELAVTTESLALIVYNAGQAIAAPASASAPSSSVATVAFDQSPSSPPSSSSVAMALAQHASTVANDLKSSGSSMPTLAQVNGALREVTTLTEFATQSEDAKSLIVRDRRHRHRHRHRSSSSSSSLSAEPSFTDEIRVFDPPSQTWLHRESMRGFTAFEVAVQLRGTLQPGQQLLLARSTRSETGQAATRVMIFHADGETTSSLTLERSRLVSRRDWSSSSSGPSLTRFMQPAIYIAYSKYKQTRREQYSLVWNTFAVHPSFRLAQEPIPSALDIEKIRTRVVTGSDQFVSAIAVECSDSVVRFWVLDEEIERMEPFGSSTLCPSVDSAIVDLNQIRTFYACLHERYTKAHEDWYAKDPTTNSWTSIINPSKWPAHRSSDSNELDWFASVKPITLRTFRIDVYRADEFEFAFLYRLTSIPDYGEWQLPESLVSNDLFAIIDSMIVSGPDGRLKNLQTELFGVQPIPSDDTKDRLATAEDQRNNGLDSLDLPLNNLSNYQAVSFVRSAQGVWHIGSVYQADTDQLAREFETTHHIVGRFSAQQRIEFNDERQLLFQEMMLDDPRIAERSTSSASNVVRIIALLTQTYVSDNPYTLTFYSNYRSNFRYLDSIGIPNPGDVLPLADLETWWERLQEETSVNLEELIERTRSDARSRSSVLARSTVPSRPRLRARSSSSSSSSSSVSRSRSRSRSSSRVSSTSHNRQGDAKDRLLDWILHIPLSERVTISL